MSNRTLLITLGILLAICLLCVCCAAAGAAAYFLLAPASSVESSVEVPPVVTPAPSLVPLPSTPLPSPTELAACPAAMQAVVDAAEAQSNETAPLGVGDSLGDSAHPDSEILAEYPVNGDLLGEPHYPPVASEQQDLQHDQAAQTEAWGYFTGMIPAEQRSMVSEFVIFTDGPGNILASVQQSNDAADQWTVEVDAADLTDRQALMFTLVHEFAHLLTLNPAQVPPDLQIYDQPDNRSLYEYKSESCPTYFPGEGCSAADSYINQFYERFWTYIREEWQPVDDLSNSDDIEGYYEALYAFYEAHQDQFVDDYAATNPSEDIAESFSYFVFGPRPQADRISNEKILFFYEFPELVQLRAQILQGFCEAHP